MPSDEVREPVFVKNLENVQGDERDVILFSICYGPDETGRVAMNFGPLNRQGGERRLNVAITRARRELIVFSTLTADQIDLARTRARGVADLKLFLSYAQHGERVLPAAIERAVEDDDFDSPLEKEICEALRGRGYEVHAQVGCSGYRIDLAVVDPDRLGRYLVGIECDGANYHSAKTARDRDRLRQSALEQLGWKLLRVWSSDWWETRDEQLERLCAAIEEIRKSPTDPSGPQLPPQSLTTTDSTSSELPAGGAPVSQFAAQQHEAEAGVYPRYTARRSGTIGTQADFYNPFGVKAIEWELNAVVLAEGPIAIGLAASRVGSAFGFERTRSAVVARVLKVAQDAGIAITKDNGVPVLWPPTLDPASWRGFRTSEPDDPDIRPAADLPIEEIANAVDHVLELNGQCPRRELQRAVARLFGFRSLGAVIARQTEAGIDYLMSSGRTTSRA